MCNNNKNLFFIALHGSEKPQYNIYIFSLVKDGYKILGFMLVIWAIYFGLHLRII